MQPRSRAERQREAAAAAAVTEESLQQEWNVQRELHLQNRAVERFRDKEKEVQHMEAAADLMPEGSEERGDLMRQAVHLRVELEREQAKNPELKQLLKAEAEAAAQAANEKSAPATEGSKIPRPAAFDAGKDAGKGAQKGLFGPAGSGIPAGGLFGLPPQAPQRSGMAAEPRSPALQQTLKPAAVAEGSSSASPQPVPPTRPQPAQPGRPHPMAPRAAQPQAVQAAVAAAPPAAQPTSPSGLENLGNQDAERRRKQNEELKRMLEEQIAEKERQRQDARSQRRGETGGEVLQNPMAPLQGRTPAVQPVRQDLNPREARLQSRAVERLREKEREVLQAEANARQMPEGSDQRADMLRHALQLRVDFERAQARNPELRQFMAPELHHQDIPLGQPSQPAIILRQGHGGEVGQPWPQERAVQQLPQAQLPPGHYPPYQGALPPFVDHAAMPQAYGVDVHPHPQVHPQIYQGPVGPADAYLGMPPGAMPGMPPGAMPGMPPGAMPGMPPGAMPGMPPGAMPGMAPGPAGPGGPAPGVATPTGLNNLGGDGQQEQRRKRQEEMKRALEEQIAEKERQKKEEAENRRQRDRQIEVPIASQMPAGGQMVPQDPGMAMPTVPMSPQVPAMVNMEGHRLGHQEDPGAEQRRKKQEEMKRVLAEQIAEKERQKKEEEERRRQEEEADNERIRREQQAEEARLEQRRQEEDARQKALQQQNAAAAAQAAAAARRAEEDDEPPGPLPNKHHGNHSRASRTTRDTQNQGFNNKSDLFGLPPSAPVASPTASPLPWETQVPQQPQQQSGTSFRSSRHHAREAAQAAHGNLHAMVNPSHAAGTGGLQGQAPMGDMLQGLMYQQQELYRHQQEALARLQDEAERLRQEKEMAKQDLLDMKAKQLEEKEKDVKKLQRKLQRQMLLQGGTQLAMDSMLPSVSSTPRPDGSGALVTSGAMEGAGPAAYLGDFYSKYETPKECKEPQQLQTERVESESGYPSDEDFRKMRRESNDPSAWPVAPVPWLQPENEQSQDPRDPRIIASIEAPNPASIGASLFEDSWGKPLEDTGQVEARLDQTKDSAREVIGSSSKVITSHSQLGKAGDPFASTKMEGTLIGESKFLQADPQGCTMGATWKDAAEMSGQALPSMKRGMVEQEKSQKTIKHEIESSSLGSTSKLLESLQVKNEDDTTDPLRILEGAVNAIREARHEDGGHSLTSSAFLSARTSGLGLDGDFGAGDSVTRRVDMAAAEIPLEDLLQSQQGWGNVLRHFGAEAAEQEAQEKPLRRQDASHHIGEGSEGGYPSLQQKLERLDQTELSSFQGADQSGRSDRVQDSLDLLQDLQQLQATSGSQATNGTNGTNGSGLGQLGTLQRPIVKDDFAALAAATPEDFDAFLARLKGQEVTGSSRGRSPQVSMNVKERAKFGSPTLRAAGSMLGQFERAPGSGPSGRPESGSSGTSDLSAPGALRELRNQRKKPKTAEDLLLHGSDLMIPGPAPGGPGTSLHATVPAEKREAMGGLQALRQEKKYQGTT